MKGMTIKFDAKKITGQIDQWSKQREIEVRKQVFRSSQVIEKDAKTAVPVGADGALRASLNTKLLNKGTLAQVGSGMLTGKKLAYAQAVEFGLKPGAEFPSYEENGSLYRWVKKKLGIVGKMTKSATFLVARKIFNEGTKGTPYLIPAFNREKPKFDSALKEILKRTK